MSNDTFLLHEVNSDMLKPYMTLVFFKIKRLILKKYYIMKERFISFL
ncbi:hypothetical protein LVDJXP189_1750008 [Flavobacterium psychrophilum]|nr:hypothetical protein LVDJXP189_1750008 [Flavobacterium psychrophilum]